MDFTRASELTPEGMLWTIPSHWKQGDQFICCGHLCEVVSVLEAKKDYSVADVHLVRREGDAPQIRYREDCNSPVLEFPATA